MKRSIALIAIAVIPFISIAQTKKDTTSKIPAPQVSTLARDSDGNTLLPIPPGTIVFAMTEEQVKLLEYVIQESQAGYKSTTQCIQILQTQRYINIPPVKKDSTVASKK